MSTSAHTYTHAHARTYCSQLLCQRDSGARERGILHESASHNCCIHCAVIQIPGLNWAFIVWFRFLWATGVFMNSDLYNFWHVITFHWTKRADLNSWHTLPRRSKKQVLQRWIFYPKRATWGHRAWQRVRIVEEWLPNISIFQVSVFVGEPTALLLSRMGPTSRQPWVQQLQHDTIFSWALGNWQTKWTTTWWRMSSN